MPLFVRFTKRCFQQLRRWEVGEVAELPDGDEYEAYIRYLEREGYGEQVEIEPDAPESPFPDPFQNPEDEPMETAATRPSETAAKSKAAPKSKTPKAPKKDKPAKDAPPQT